MSNKSGSGSLYMLSDAVVDQINDLLKSSSKNDGPVAYDDSGSDDEMSIPCNENKKRRTSSLPTVRAVSPVPTYAVTAQNV